MLRSARTTANPRLNLPLLFEALDEPARQALLRAGSLQYLPARARAEIDAKAPLMFVLDGWVYRAAVTRNGGRNISSLFLTGDCCNADAVSRETLWSAGKAVLFTVPRDRLDRIIADHPSVTDRLLAFVSQDCAVLRERHLYVSRHPALVRLAYLLCELDVRLGNLDGENSEFDCPLTQTDIADMLGLTSVHVNRVMQQLRREELLISDYHHYELPNVAALRRLADFDPGYLLASNAGRGEGTAQSRGDIEGPRPAA